MKNKILSQLTITRLRKVGEAILKDPHLYDQCSLSRRNPRTCGSPACLLGWAVHMFKDTSGFTIERDEGQLPCFFDADGNYLMLSQAGSIALGFKFEGARQRDERLVSPEALRLFEPTKWPQKYYDDYMDAETNLGWARVAVKRIEHFIKTDGAE